ncbi:probable low affinity copper uptake protein 2 [Adelges cooleyi]|uniref:probable low affinity copper uptake protein 2 n=1 Tax=Adelges cooleyi TaxID=133065 RepID=UPI00217FDD60|nr:probable low affinity copper uptake protein 2 [Adelges cooleyi]
MSFTFNPNIEPFLIKNFNIQTTIGLFTICVGLTALAIVFESLKTFHYMSKVHKRLRCCSQPNCKDYVNKEMSSVTLGTKIIDCVKGLGVYSLQMLIGYVLMCAVMTYNAFVFIAVVGGYGVGYWLFGLTMMQLTAKNLLKSNNVPIKCRKCTTVNNNKNGHEEEESTCTEISDNSPGTSSTIVVDVHCNS